MNIEYRRPTTEDKRRRAGFWLGAGQFLTATLTGYIMLGIVIVLVWVILIVKILKQIL